MPFFRLIVPVHDLQRLTAAIDRARNSWVTYAPYLDLFRSQLHRALKVQPDQVPDDMITMNSRFAIANARTGEVSCYTLVYPQDEAPLRGKVSVLSPMGQALYGARVGGRVFWTSSAGPEAATVQELHYRPEAAERNTFRDTRRTVSGASVDAPLRSSSEEGRHRNASSDHVCTQSVSGDRVRCDAATDARPLYAN